MTAPQDDVTTDPQTDIAALRAERDAALADKVALADALAARAAELATRNTEYDERIGYQSATSDVLKAMSGSPDDPQPVFDLIVERARDLCDAYGVTVFEFDGRLVHLRAVTGVSDDPKVREAVVARYPMPPSRDMFPCRAILDRQLIRIDDLESELGLSPIYRSLTVKSAVTIPLMRGDVAIGALTMGSRERGGFTDGQIELLKIFAEQAVIAIENARLFNETKEALERQTATADILNVIASSPDDVQPVFVAIATSANRLLGGFSTAVFRFFDGVAHLKAFTPTTPSADEVLKAAFPSPLAGFEPFTLAQRGQPVQIRDIEELPDSQIKNVARARGFRSMLFSPLMSNGVPIGLISVTRLQIGSYVDHLVQLLQTFADQAVIAISNVGLFNKVQERTTELSETLEYQTAISDVLNVISRSPNDLQPVMNTIVHTARRLCQSEYALMLLRNEVGNYEIVAHSNASIDLFEWMQHNPVLAGDGSVIGITAAEKRTVHMHDALSDPRFSDLRRQRVSKGRTMLGVPLLRDQDVIGVILLVRTEVRPYTDKQVELVSSFADQAIIAIQNVRLFEEVQERTRELSQSLDDLRTAQDRLVQTEKLASLGQLTAGIAHEIKNPLNFVNNFSSLSAELVRELDETLVPVTLDQKTRLDVSELTQMLKSNLEKVVQHGKRADSIVKNMLLHSREGSGEHRPADINALVEESLNLAYHGARAEKSGFNITLKHDFDPHAGEIDLYPQQITRALLNLISNGFYAATRRKSEAGDDTFEPTLGATTRNLGNRVEIHIRDNGSGIPLEMKETMFNPFFTTKPPGEGTGLGLSMSHDIIVKQHGGSIDVETETGVFTEFIITLPRNGAT